MATGTLSVSVTVQDSATAPLGTYLGNPAISGSTNYTTSNVVTGVYQAKVTSSSSTTTYTVNNASLSNEYGVALTYTTIQGVIIQNNGTANLVVGGGTHPLFGSDQYTVQAGETLPVANVPITVSSTVNTITITPAASTSWSIMILG